MIKDCLDIGIIQAFLDSELAQSETARVSAHIEDCDSCALLFSQAEEESAIVFPALAREFDALVPTQRLWNKINDSIAAERENRPFWQKAWGYISVAFVSPTFAAAASLVLVIGVVSALWINKNVVPAIDTTNLATATEKRSVSPSVNVPAVTLNDEPEKIIGSAVRPAITAERAAYRTENRRTETRVANAVTSTGTPVDSSGFMPGEESYVRTISTLNKNVQGQKDDLLRPAERIAYERDMAVVNDTISKMRQEVKKNPKNEAAKQVLYTSYQNKIDLLNSVAQKEELVASLR